MPTAGFLVRGSHARRADGVEGAHQARAGQQLGGREPGALVARPGRDLAVAVHERIAGVDDDLALEQVARFLGDFGQRAVGHRHHDDLAECRGLAWRAGACAAAQLRRERPVVLEVA